MSKEKQKKSLLDLITAENLQKVNSDKKGLEELTKRFNAVTEFLFATDEVQKVLKEKDQKIADLEGKLDEKTRIVEGYSELLDKRQHENYEQFCEIQQLKQQLAKSKEQLNNSEQKCLICHKDQENEQLKKEIEYLQKQCEINQDVIDLMRQNSKKDKISFAVEKLEEVKYYAQHIQGGLINYIENQIKAIKGEK